MYHKYRDIYAQQELIIQVKLPKDLAYRRIRMATLQTTDKLVEEDLAAPSPHFHTQTQEYMVFFMCLLCHV